MKIFIYISDNFSKNYLPFLLYRNTIYDILLDNTNFDIKFIDNFNDFVDSIESILILNIYCFNKNLESNFYFLNHVLSKVILINTEFYTHCNVDKLLKYINSNKNNKFFIFDYNKINIKKIKELYKNVNINYFPLIYNKYLENFYLENINNKKISWINKDIDILFYGSLNERRSKILEKLKTRYNVVYFIDLYNHKLFL